MMGAPLSLFLPCLLITEFNLLPRVSRKVLVLLRVILDQRSRFFSLPDLSSIFHPTHIVIYFFPHLFLSLVLHQQRYYCLTTVLTDHCVTFHFQLWGNNWNHPSFFLGHWVKYVSQVSESTPTHTSVSSQFEMLSFPIRSHTHNI